MKRMAWSCLAVTLAACGGETSESPVSPDESAVGESRQAVQGETGRWLVVFKAPTLPADAGARIHGAGGRPKHMLHDVGVATAVGGAAFADAMRRQSDVLVVGPERFHRKDELNDELNEQPEAPPVFGAPTAADDQYNVQWGIRRVGAPAMWARVPMQTQAHATVAVIDSGVMDDHPDLVGQVVASYGMNLCPETGGSNNTAGYPRHSRYADFVANPDFQVGDECQPFPFDIYVGHGTHVSGTIAARFGGGSVVGVAPGVKIASYRVSDLVLAPLPGGGAGFQLGVLDGPVLNAMLDASARGYKVLNMSLGFLVDRGVPEGEAYWQAFERVTKEVTRRGSLIVAAAGNNGLTIAPPLAMLPASVPDVLAVAATAVSAMSFENNIWQAVPGSDVHPAFSNSGSFVDISAPGYAINSTYVFGGTPDYVFTQGTSMASPHVAAVAAVVRAQHPSWSPKKTRKHLMKTAQSVGDPLLFGAGVVDADAATRPNGNGNGDDDDDDD